MLRRSLQAAGPGSSDAPAAPVPRRLVDHYKGLFAGQVVGPADVGVTLEEFPYYLGEVRGRLLVLCFAVLCSSVLPSEVRGCRLQRLPVSSVVLSVMLFTIATKLEARCYL